jgi:hypothetical protein
MRRRDGSASSSSVPEGVLVPCVLVGAYLRVRGISSQLPMDDEWHGLDFVLTRDAWLLLTHFSRAGANIVLSTSFCARCS